MNNSITTLETLHSNADQIENHGGTVTENFTKVRTRWRETYGHKADYAAHIAAALTGDTEPDPDAIAHTEALALAHATATPVNTATVRQAVAANLLTHQRTEWDKTLTANYETAATAYKQAATALTTALNQVDPEANPESLMDAPTKTRTAWAEIPMLTARVDKAATFLTFTATQLNVPTTEEHQLALTAQIPDDTDRRTVWEQLDANQGRAGTWGTLHRLGATLTAPHTPDPTTHYRRPKPLETRYLRTQTGLRPVDYDPETNTPEDAVPAQNSRV